jgi:hypothetical protein
MAIVDSRQQQKNEPSRATAVYCSTISEGLSQSKSGLTSAPYLPHTEQPIGIANSDSRYSRSAGRECRRRAFRQE